MEIFIFFGFFFFVFSAPLTIVDTKIEHGELNTKRAPSRAVGPEMVATRE